MRKPPTLIVLSIADFSACGSNQNYPLIDYLQGSRKALMDLILNPPQIFKVSFWSGLLKNPALSFLQDGQVKPASGLEWASPARAAVRWDYGTTVGKGSATQGEREMARYVLNDFQMDCWPRFSHWRYIVSLVNLCSMRCLNLASL